MARHWRRRGGQASRASLILPFDAAFDTFGAMWILQSGKLSPSDPEWRHLRHRDTERVTGIAIDGSNNFLSRHWSKRANHKITAAGVASVVAGSGTAGFSWRRRSAVQAQLALAIFALAGLAVDSSGNLYIATWTIFVSAK